MRLCCVLVGLLVSVRAQGGPPPRPEPVPVMVMGAAAGGITLTRPTSDFRHELYIASTAAGPIEIHIDVTRLAAPDSSQAAVTFTVDGKATDGAVPIPPNGRVVLAVAATLPLTGIYTGSINFTAAGHTPMSVPLAVTRTRAAVSAQFKDVVPVSGRRWSDVSARFSVYETAGQYVTVYTPQLSGLARVLGDGKQQQADITGTPKVFRLDGTTEVPMGAGQLIRLRPGELQDYTITIEGLTPGQYTGTIHLASPDAVMADQAATFFVRAPAAFAALFFAGGVFGSLLLRWYYQTKRPAIVNERTASVLRAGIEAARLRGPLDDEAARVLATIERRLSAAMSRIALGEPVDSAAIFLEVQGRVNLFPMWIDARARVAAIHPEPLARPFRATVAQALVVLLRDGATEADIGTTRKSLEDLPGLVTAALEQELAAGLAAFDVELSRQEQRPHPPAAAAALGAMRLTYDEAQSAFAAGQLADAVRLLQDARIGYVPVLAGELEAALSSAAPPLGLDAAEWQELARDVRGLLSTIPGQQDPQHALDQYRAAHAVYVRALLKGLNAADDTQAGQLAARGTQVTAEEKDRVTALLAGLKARVVAAIARVDAGEIDAASDAYRDIAAALVKNAKVVSPSGALGVTAGPAATAHLPPAMADAMTADLRTPPPLTAIDAAKQSAEMLTRQLTRWDFGVTTFIAAIAVLIGLRIWAADATWGDFDDYLAAVLWGLGLHQFTFDGVSGLAARFAR